MNQTLDPDRLPQTVRPAAYDLNLTVQPEEGVFSGRVGIRLEIPQPVNTIHLHAQGIQIGEVFLENAERKLLPDLPPEIKNHFLSLNFSETIPPGTAYLNLSFSGKLNRQMKGLYEARGTFNGKEEKYAFTHFEPTDARRLFPCFDEPAFKAVFHVTASAPEYLSILSNMPPNRETQKNGMKTVEFQPTPVMSTYLLALAVGRFESKKRTIAGTEVSVYAMPQEIHLSDFALEVTEGVLPLLNDYFGKPYPYPKLDHIAVPDFAMGAMENWGAIFYRDSRLLVDEQRASTATKRIVANVITHEIVHQWFGNLVTMEWWNDLWLNEAFATWLACKIVDQWKPQWRCWDEFQLEKQVPLELDALDSSRPIVSDVSSSAEIEAMFDPLTYEKGAAVLRMIEHFLGEDPFREGIRKYMNRYAFKNTKADDLWKELETASKQPIGSIAKDWLTQPGYPIVTAVSTSKNKTRIEIGQKRFSAHGKNAPQQGSWAIPLTVRFEDAAGTHSQPFLLKDKKTEIRLKGKEPIRWVYPNAGEAGYFRVHIGENLLEAFRQTGPLSLSPAERIGFLNHLWALTKGREVPIGHFLNALLLFKEDSTRVVVEAIATYIECLSDRLVEDDIRPLFPRFVVYLFNPLWEKLGWDGYQEDDEVRLTRNALLWVLGSSGKSSTLIRETENRLEMYLNHPSACDPTLSTTLVRLGARNGDESRFSDYLKRFRTGDTPEDRDRFLYAMTEFLQPEAAQKLMELTLTDSIRGQDLWKPLRLLLGHPRHQRDAWGFVKTHWHALAEKTGPVGALRIIQGTKALWGEEWFQDVSSFFNHPSNRVESAAKALQQTLEFIRLGIEFKTQQREPLTHWLKGFIDTRTS